jgi:hypothetical protein
MHSKQYILDCGGSVLSPILGIIASQNYPRSTNSYESIATTTLATSTASVTFSSIPATYTHLQIRMIARDDRASSTSDSGAFRFNSDSGNNYAYHALIGTGSTATVSAVDTYSRGLIDRLTASTAGASTFGVAVLDILDYANTSKYKTVRILGGYDNNGDGQIVLSSGLWQSTSAISSILIFPNVGSNWVQYSSFALYGIKGA